VTSATAALPITLTPRLMRMLILSLLLAAAGYLGLAFATGWDDTWRAVARVGAGGLAIGCGLTLAGFLLRFCRWQWYLGALGLGVDRLQSFVIYLSGFALTTTPGKVGELLRSAFLARHNVTYTQSFAAFFADRLTDLLSVVTLTMIGLSLYPKSRYGLWVLGATLLAVVVLIAAAPLLVEWGERGQNGWLTRTLAWGARILAQAKNCLVPQRMLPGWCLGCCAYAAQGLSFHLMLVAMGYDIGLPVAIFVFAFASLVGALSFIPGGLGTADATVFFLLVHFGVTKPEAASATVLIRVTTLWFAVAVGLGSAGWLTLRKADRPSAT
jgi:uncharacterized membrane protein YbhN (UPF0104 family)